MSDERIMFAIDTVLPLLRETGELFSRLVSQGISLAAAKAQIRNILAVGVGRLQAAEDEDKRRDAAHDARVKHTGVIAEAVSTVTKADEDTKP